MEASIQQDNKKAKDPKWEIRAGTEASIRAGIVAGT